MCLHKISLWTPPTNPLLAQHAHHPAQAPTLVFYLCPNIPPLVLYTPPASPRPKI